MLFWIIGHNGQLASTWRRLLSKVSSRTLEVEYNAAEGIPFISTSSKQVDLTNPEQVFDFYQKNKPTHILNCSAYTAVDLAEKEREKASDLNDFALQSLAMLPAKIVHYSTDYVFDGTKGAIYVEGDTPNPLNHYGETKLAGEARLSTHREALIIRSSWLFSTDGNNFFNTIASFVAEKKANSSCWGSIWMSHFYSSLGISLS